MSRRRQPISNINVVPYLDVMLVLLVIFMITTPLLSQGVVDVPSVGNKAKVNTAPKAQLEVAYRHGDKNPYILFDRSAGEESPPLALPELMGEINKKKLLYPERVIILSVEKLTPFEEAIRVMETMHGAGFTVGLRVQQRGN